MPELPWSTRIIKDANENWQQIYCEITPQGLTDALTSVAGGKTLRSASHIQQSDVLLATDVILINDVLVGLNITANRDRVDPSRFFIEASLVFEEKLDSALRASLTLGGQVWDKLIDSGGHAVFPSLPIDSLIDFNLGRATTNLCLTIHHS